MSQAKKELKELTKAEVAKHNADGDLWITIHNQVYDFSSFASVHPGGEQSSTKLPQNAS